MTATPKPGPAAPQPTPGLRTSVDDVLRLILGRVDASRATPADVRQRLHDAGVTVTEEWATDWLQRAAEIRERKTTMTATTTLDAWTVKTLADAIGAPEDVTEHVLDRDVAAGRCVRITSGTTVYYVPGRLQDRLADLGAEPVEGERFRMRRAQARGTRVGSLTKRTADVRRRIRDLTASDDCGCGAPKEAGK